VIAGQNALPERTFVALLAGGLPADGDGPQGSDDRPDQGLGGGGGNGSDESTPSTHATPEAPQAPSTQDGPANPSH
jgi:hypothetical protein